MESIAAGGKFTERQVCTMSRLGSTCRIVPQMAPSKARKAAPGSAAIVTGSPVNAVCSRGSKYISKSRSGGAGKGCRSDRFLVMEVGFRQVSQVRRLTLRQPVDSVISQP